MSPFKINIVDANKERIDAWNNADLNKLPIYEPGLSDIIGRCRNNNLFLFRYQKTYIRGRYDIYSVNTPTKLKGIGAGQASD